MNPRTKPSVTDEGLQATKELDSYHWDPENKPDLARVIVFWQEVGRPSGFPRSWTHDGVVSANGIDWRIYLRKFGRFYAGFCESMDGHTLRLLMIKAKENFTKNDAIIELRNRV